MFVRWCLFDDVCSLVFFSLMFLRGCLLDDVCSLHAVFVRRCLFVACSVCAYGVCSLMFVRWCLFVGIG